MSISFEQLAHQDTLHYSSESATLDNNNIYVFSYESIAPTEVAQPVNEMEFNVKATLVDPLFLKELGSYVDIEQWTTMINPTPTRPTKGSMRVRRTTNPTGVSEYTSTDKLLVQSTDNHGYSHRLEHTVQISKEHFDLRKLITNSGQIKRRYTVKCELDGPFKGYNWEIDIFYTKDGELTNCCMVEMEVNEKIDKEMPLPNGFEKMTEMQIQVAKQKIFSISH